MGLSDTMAHWYLLESGGNLEGFHAEFRQTFRYGQAFFNALTPEDQAKLRGSLFDPFHDNAAAVREAIDFLTKKDSDG